MNFNICLYSSLACSKKNAALPSYPVLSHHDPIAMYAWTEDAS